MELDLRIIFTLVLAVTYVNANEILHRKFQTLNEVKYSKNPSDIREEITRAIAATKSSSGRITGGEVAPVNGYPYHVGIVANYGRWCGGALISDQHVLTSADCVHDAMYVILYLGVNNIRDDNQLDLSFLVYVKDIMIHPDWDFTRFYNDIAIIPLPQKVQFSDRIKSIGLPLRSDDSINYELGNTIATGWGYIDDNSTEITPHLRFAQIPLEPFAICRHFYPYLFSGMNICIGGRSKSKTCLRDEGGPLVYTRKDGSRFVVGLVSYVGPLECSSLWPALTTRVSRYVDWISEVIGQN